MKVLAVMPELRIANAGGIQVSGELAWHAIRDNFDSRLLEVPNGRRVAAISAARRVSFMSDVVLFWHLDLLKLAPLLNTAGRRVVFLHGIEAWRQQGMLMRKLLSDCHIMANSHYTLQRARPFLQQLESREATVVPLGIGEPETGSIEPAVTPAAIMIGRLDGGERYKGHHEVISAWSRVTQQIAGAQLWIVGDGDLRSELETHVRDVGATDVVRFFGRVAETEKQKLLRAARCLLLPSRGEGFGLVYLEAMRHGRPCIVGTDAGREVVEPPTAGVTVDAGHEAALTEAIVNLLRGGAEWQRMSTQARRRYEQQFTAAHFQERLLAALRKAG